MDEPLAVTARIVRRQVAARDAAGLPPRLRDCLSPWERRRIGLLLLGALACCAAELALLAFVAGTS